MRKRFLYIIACAIIGLTASITATAYADHGHTTLAVPECQAYINVLETLDQLYLCRTTSIELSHGDPLDALGTSSAVLIIEAVGAPVRTVALPRPNYGLASIYFGASDTDIPVWSSTTTFLHLSENPAFFGSPATSTPPTAPVFNPNVDLDTTATEITADLPRIMLRLEFDDPTRGQSSIDPRVLPPAYVQGTSITELGKAVIIDAFPQLGVLAIGAFGLPIEDAGGAFTNPPDPSFVTDFEAAGRNSPWAQAIEAAGLRFGFPYIASVFIVMLIFLGAIVFFIWRSSKETSTTYIWVWPVMFIGSAIGGWPLAATILVAVLAASLALAIIINRNIPS